MAAMAGLIHRSMTAGQALSGMGASPKTAAPAATGSSSSSSSSGSGSATISANDFLSLLVTEMRNQDPTANTDPNEYINQLVQVNSLEQLIDINQNLSTALGNGGNTSSGTSGSAQGAAGLASGGSVSNPASTGPATAAHRGGAAHKAGSPVAAGSGRSTTAEAIGQFAQSVGAKQAPGNLAVPSANSASQRVAHALDGHSHAPAIPGRLSVSQ